MSYLEPNIIAGSTSIDADDIRENLDAIKKYISTGIAAADIDSGVKWIDTKHIMKPEYSGLLNTGTFVSGFLGGKSYTVPSSYLSKYNTKRIASSTDYPWSFIPNTTIIIEIPRQVNLLMFQLSAWNISDTNENTYWGEAELELVIKASNITVDDIANNLGLKTHTIGYSSEEYASVGAASTVEQLLRQPYQTFYMLEDVGPGFYTVSLIGRSAISKTAFYAWSFSAESWL